MGLRCTHVCYVCKCIRREFTCPLLALLDSQYASNARQAAAPWGRVHGPLWGVCASPLSRVTQALMPGRISRDPHVPRVAACGEAGHLGGQGGSRAAQGGALGAWARQRGSLSWQLGACLCAPPAAMLSVMQFLRSLFQVREGIVHRSVPATAGPRVSAVTLRTP